MGNAGIPRCLPCTVIERVTVVTGGSTPERDVALVGAAQVVRALRERGYHVQVVDTTCGTLGDSEEARFLAHPIDTKPPDQLELDRLAKRELGPRLAQLPAVLDADVAFLVLHGRQGEGGEVQAVLDLAGVCYTGSGPLGSGLAMDKDMAKRLFRYHNIPTPDWEVWPAPRDAVERLGFPLVVKPSKVGSTVGLSIVSTWDEIEPAVEVAQHFDDEILLESYVDGRELTVGILDQQALGVGEILPKHPVFDYECKYTPGMSEEIFPAVIPLEVRDQIRQLALTAHLALKLRDFSRVDFRLAADGTPYCLEVNTLPGLTPTSLLPQSARCEGIEFAELCDRVCRSAHRRARSWNKVANSRGLRTRHVQH